MEKRTRFVIIRRNENIQNKLLSNSIDNSVKLIDDCFVSTPRVKNMHILFKEVST